MLSPDGTDFFSLADGDSSAWQDIVQSSFRENLHPRVTLSVVSFCRPGRNEVEIRDPGLPIAHGLSWVWIPAFAGMTDAEDVKFLFCLSSFLLAVLERILCF